MRVKVGEVQLFYDVEGPKLRPDGPAMREVPTLLLLHGGPGGDHSSFKPAYSALTDVAQIIYLDHRGQGRSDRSTPERWNLAQWAYDVKLFCDTLGIERPIVLGLSFGGFVALAYATRYPEHCAKLILCSTRAGPPEPEREIEVFERLGGPEAGAVARRFLIGSTVDADALRDFVRLCRPLYTRAPYDLNRDLRQAWRIDVLRHFRASEDYTFDYVAKLRQIKCPTLVLVGEDDPITPPCYSDQIVAAMQPGLARYERFANAGHGIAGDAPTHYFRVLREFISDRQ